MGVQSTEITIIQSFRHVKMALFLLFQAHLFISNAMAIKLEELGELF